MTSGSTNAKALADGRHADSARRRQRVIAAINRAVTDGTGVSVPASARAAVVDRTFLCGHRDLLGQIHAAQAGLPAGAAGPGVTPGLAASRPARRPACSPARRPHPAAGRRLSEALGEQAWRDCGLGAGTGTVNHAITGLDQQAADLRSQLEQRDSEFAAARAAKRELMTQLNAARHR